MLDLNTLHLIRTTWDAREFQFETMADGENAFNKLCEMLSELANFERALVIEMLNDYEKIPFQQYPALLSQALTKVDTATLDGVHEVFLLPLLNSADRMRGTSKSGHAVLYIAEHVCLKQHPLLKQIKTTALVSIEALERPEFAKREGALLIFVDDFIGSGATCLAAHAEYARRYKRAGDKPLVLTLVGMGAAIKQIEDNGISIICGKTLSKGISDNPRFVDKHDAFLTVDSIEGNLERHSDYRWGYLQSESLVSLIRTPDNTFPMFWCRSRLGGGTWPAPFER
jgi:hypothetical protein